MPAAVWKNLQCLQSVDGEIVLAFFSYCSLVTFREVFFVNKVHRKPENCGAKRVTGHGVNSNT